MYPFGLICRTIALEAAWGEHLRSRTADRKLIQHCRLSTKKSKMSVEDRRRYEVADLQYLHQSTTGPGDPIATLAGRPLVSNRGIPLNLDWVQQVRVNTSAVERRAQSHTLRAAP